MNRRDILPLGAVFVLSVLVVVMVGSRSQWLWIGLGALGVLLVMAALASGHWARSARAIAGVAGVVLVIVSVLPWFDFMTGQ